MSQTFTARHVKTIYRALLRELRVIPDPEIRSYYGGRYRDKAQNLIRPSAPHGSAVSGLIGRAAELQVKRYATFRKDLRQIVAANDGGHASFTRMVDNTYCRRGARRHLLLNALYPPTLSRPSPETLSSSRYPRRLLEPPPLPQVLQNLVKKAKSSSTGPRERLGVDDGYGGSGRRNFINKKWAERTQMLEKMNLPLRFAGLVEGDWEMSLMSPQEKKDRERWRSLAARLWMNAQDLSSLPETGTDQTRTMTDSALVDSKHKQRVQHSIPGRTRRRMYKRLLDGISVDRQFAAEQMREVSTDGAAI